MHRQETTPTFQASYRERQASHASSTPTMIIDFSKPLGHPLRPLPTWSFRARNSRILLISVADLKVPPQKPHRRPCRPAECAFRSNTPLPAMASVATILYCTLIAP